MAPNSELADLKPRRDEIQSRNEALGRVHSVISLRLPEEDEEVVLLTRTQKVNRKLADVWPSVVGMLLGLQ